MMEVGKEELTSTRGRVLARLTNMENAIQQLKEVELQLTSIGEVSLISLEIADKL